MPGVHAILLLTAARDVAEMFHNDPKVADLLDPAVYIAADGDGVIASIVERLQLTELVAGLEPTARKPIWDESPPGASIAVLVKDDGGSEIYRVPDPRTNPDAWPWMGIEGDKG
jgi:hypothetical protein